MQVTKERKWCFYSQNAERRSRRRCSLRHCSLFVVLSAVAHFPKLFKSCHLVCAICLAPKSEWVWHNRATVLLSCSIYSSVMRNQQRDWHGARCHTYTPMKLFLGHMACLQGATWLLWLGGTRSTDLDLSSSEGCHEGTLPCILV